ncbi:hypothetical protein PSPO01_01599 [Paraphaeosphaeria sporulosa]
MASRPHSFYSQTKGPSVAVRRPGWANLCGGACVGARCFEPLCAHTWGDASTESEAARGSEHNARKPWARRGSRVCAGMRCVVGMNLPSSGHVAPLRLPSIASPGSTTVFTAGVYVFIQGLEGSMGTCLAAQPPGHYSAAAAASRASTSTAEAQYWLVKLFLWKESLAGRIHTSATFFLAH